MPEDFIKDLIRWQGVYNDKNRTIRDDELQRNSRPEPGNNSETETEASQDSTSPRRKYKGNKNRQVRTAIKTTVKNLGLASQTVRVSMKDDDDDSSKSDDSDESTSSKLEEASHQHTTSKVGSLLRKKNRRQNGLDGRDHGTTRK